MADYVIRHREGWPDEVAADGYVERDGELIFTRDGEEVLRVPVADVQRLEHPLVVGARKYGLRSSGIHGNRNDFRACGTSKDVTGPQAITQDSPVGTLVGGFLEVVVLDGGVGN